MNKKESIIFDFETLSLNRVKGVILSLAALKFDENRFSSDNPYTWDELVDSTDYIKFDVNEQVKNYNRVIDSGTLEWWSNLPEESKGCFYPSENDRPLKEIYSFLKKMWPSELHRIYSRGNAFDPILLDYILEDINEKPFYVFSLIRDTRSFIEGLSYGTDLQNSFIPQEYKNRFIKHNSIHDIVMDVIRIQFLVRIIDNVE